MSDYIPDWDAPGATSSSSFTPDWDKEPAKATALPPGVIPSTAGGGRGGQGGPSVAQAQLHLGNQSHRFIPPSVTAGGTGLVKGATLGLSKYITAGQAYLVDAARGLMEGNPGMSWEQALEYTKQAQEQAAENNPKSFYGGQVAGTVLNAAATGGATVPQLAVRGAIQGGVTGFTNNENLGEAAAGATIGAVTGGTVGAAAKGVGAAKDYAVKKIAPHAEKYLQQGMTAVFKPFQDKVEQLAVKYGINPASENAYAQLGSVATASERAELNQLATQAANVSLPKAMTIQNIKDFGTGAVQGGLTGAAFSGLTGGDPVTGALYGAGLGGGGKVIANKAGEIFAPYAARVLHKSALTNQGYLPQPEPGSFGQFVTPETLSRMGTASLTAPQTLKDANASLSELFNHLK